MADEAYLYDLPLSFYQQAVVTDGQFDPEKAKAAGYNEGQFEAIEKFLGLDKADTAPLPEAEVTDDNDSTQE